MNRWGFVVSGGAAAIGLSAASAQAPDPYYSREFLNELFATNSEDISVAGAGVRLSGAQYADIVDVLKRGAVRAVWPEDAQAPDYAHLDEVMSEESFRFDADALRTLAEANGFLPAASRGKVLFGLRGCHVASPAQGDAIELVESKPDHWTQNCVIGVWDMEDSALAAFDASTVTDAAYMYAQATRIEGANLMPTGRYHYEVGTHAWRRASSRQPGALRQVGSWPVRRIVQMPDDGVLSYTHDAAWDVPGSVCGTRGSTGNNIHAGVLDRWTGGVKFSSAGCQTLPGRYEPKGRRPSGPWRQFRKAAGLPEDPSLIDAIGFDGATPTVKTPEDGRRFRYLLLTGREARLAAFGMPRARLARVRYGSVGEAAVAVQARLSEKVDRCLVPGGAFGMKSVAALVKFQRETGFAPDGIVSPPVADLLGVSL